MVQHVFLGFFLPLLRVSTLLAQSPVVKLKEVPPPVLYNVRRKGNRQIVHLLNNDDACTYPVRLWLKVAVGLGWEPSPDHPEVEPVVQRPLGEIEIRRLKRYSVVVLEKGAGELPASTRPF